MHADRSGGAPEGVPEERDCRFSQSAADKVFGRKGLANDCIPRNPCTAIFTRKEPPIVGFCCGWNRKDWFGGLVPRLWIPSRSSRPPWTSPHLNAVVISPASADLHSTNGAFLF